MRILLDLGVLEAGTMLALLNYVYYRSPHLLEFLALVNKQNKKTKKKFLTNVISLFIVKLRVKNYKVS